MIANFKKMNFVGIIPARYESTLLPGKPLLLGRKTHYYQGVRTGLRQVLPVFVVADI